MSKFLQKIHLQPTAINFVLVFIPHLYLKLLIWREKDKLPVVQTWNFSTSIPLKTLINEYQYWLPLRHTSKKMIWDIFKKQITFQFNVSYMILPTLKGHITHREKVTKNCIIILSTDSEVYQNHKQKLLRFSTH